MSLDPDVRRVLDGDAAWGDERVLFTRGARHDRSPLTGAERPSLR